MILHTAELRRYQPIICPDQGQTDHVSLCRAFADRLADMTVDQLNHLLGLNESSYVVRINEDIILLEITRTNTRRAGRGLPSEADQNAAYQARQPKTNHDPQTIDHATLTTRRNLCWSCDHCDNITPDNLVLCDKAPHCRLNGQQKPVPLAGSCPVGLW